MRAFQVVVGTEAPSGLPRFDLAGALASLGPEDSSAKTEFEGALKRAKAQEGAPTRIDPDARVGAARERVARLEQAIAAMGNCQGPELDMLIISLKKAQKDAQEMPLEAQIRAREAFIERSKKRIEQFDVERAAEVQRLEESQRRLEELRAMVLSCSANCTTACRCQCRSEPTPANGVGLATEEEVLEWLADRQEHGADGWESCGSRTHLWINHRCYQKLASHRGRAVHGLQHGQMIVARRSSRYGMRGVRVGEASNPGPQLSCQRSPSQGSTEESVMPASEELQEDFEGTQVRRRTRRRVLSDDDLPLTQVLPVFSHKASRRGPRRFR